MRRLFIYSELENLKIKKNMLESEGYECTWNYDIVDQKYHLYAYYFILFDK